MDRMVRVLRRGFTCNQGGCHNDGIQQTNSFNFSISGIPSAGYVPGTTYTITVAFSGLSGSKWGFEAMVTDANNVSTGTIVITDGTRTQINFNGKYVKHKFFGTSSKSWSFNWEAPSTDVGTITFYAAGNQANNNGQNTGDIIHTTSLARVANTNINPVISTTSLPDATVSATDADAGDELTYSITSGPSWLSISDSTLSGTPANDDVGDNAVTIKVSDNASPAGSATLSTTITVINVNDPPVIATTNLDDAEENTAYLFTIDASDPDVGDTFDL